MQGVFVKSERAMKFSIIHATLIHGEMCIRDRIHQGGLYQTFWEIQNEKEAEVLSLVNQGSEV